MSTTTAADSMQVDKEGMIPADDAALHDTDVVEEEEEEDVEDLEKLLEDAQNYSNNKDTEQQIKTLITILSDSEKTSTKAIQLKERAVYELTRAYCASQQYQQVVEFLTTTGQIFLSQIAKAKTAKVVRQVLDIVCTAAPDAVDMQESVARSIIQWTVQEKRSFLRQRVEAKLASILFQQNKYVQALELCDRLLLELKKLDDKQLLVETHLLESKIHFALHNVPKSKAALTASRTAANAIYVPPRLQAEIDNMSGTIHTEEGDYQTAHSYFLEALEQLDPLNLTAEATVALKYMMLCQILHALRAALQLSSQGNVGAKTTNADVDMSGLVSGKQGIKYAGRDLDAMMAIAKAAGNRNLREFEHVLQEYSHELQDDLVIKHHLHILQEQLLESNLIRIIEPYSCVELTHVATRMEMHVSLVERKLSQMILDGKLQGILDQGQGQLIVYEDSQHDMVVEKGLQVISNMDSVVSSLFERSKALRNMMI